MSTYCLLIVISVDQKKNGLILLYVTFYIFIVVIVKFCLVYSVALLLVVISPLLPRKNDMLNNVNTLEYILETSFVCSD